MTSGARRLILARGDLAGTPKLYSIFWYPIIRIDEPLERYWTWLSPTPGLSVITATQGDYLRDIWQSIADRCRRNPRYFDSLLQSRAIESYEFAMTAPWSNISVPFNST
jgi:hypothetical protein